jgi:hypothetical protein
MIHGALAENRKRKTATVVLVSGAKQFIKLFKSELRRSFG